MNRNRTIEPTEKLYKTLENIALRAQMKVEADALRKGDIALEFVRLRQRVSWLEENVNTLLELIEEEDNVN